jgi:hypothetical protein
MGDPFLAVPDYLCFQIKLFPEPAGQHFQSSFLLAPQLAGADAQLIRYLLLTELLHVLVEQGVIDSPGA